MVKEQTVVQRIKDHKYDNPTAFFCDYGHEYGMSVDDYTDEELRVIESVTKNRSVIIFQDRESKKRVSELIYSIHVSNLVRYKSTRDSMISYIAPTEKRLTEYRSRLKGYCKESTIPHFRDIVLLRDLHVVYRKKPFGVMRTIKALNNLLLFDDVLEHENVIEYAEFFDSISSEAAHKNYQFVIVLDTDRTDHEFVNEIKILFNQPNIDTIYL